MARKRKKRKKLAIRKSPTSRNTAFNPLLQDGTPLKEWAERQEPPEKADMAPDSKTSQTAPSDAEIFLKAVGDVKPLRSPNTIVTRYPDPSLKPRHPAPNDELEAMTHLWELVHGSGEMDISFSDEYIQGSVRGFDRKLMRRLRRGEFPVQDYLDLHGLTKRDAEVRVREFLIRSYSIGLRCVLLIHGRGLNSEDHIPILKERIPVWLSRGPVRKLVLAFSTARPYDGGTGAIYVLLRRKKGKPYLQV